MSAVTKTFIAVAKFKVDVTPQQIFDLVPAEQIQAKRLTDQGLMGFIKVAMPKRTVFIELFADSEPVAAEALSTLPLAQLWDAEIFETTPPAGAAS